METKICSKCKIEQPLENYHKNGFNKNGEQKYRGYCKTCANALEIQRYYKKKEYIDNQRTQCVKCGESRPHVLDFHHIDKDTKDFTVGRLKKGSLSIIQKEINKCICLCANCHRDFHYLEKKQNISLKDYIDVQPSG